MPRIRVLNLAEGIDFSIHGLVVPSDIDIVEYQIVGLDELLEVDVEMVTLTLDPSLESVPYPESDLKGLDITVSDWDIIVVLPRDFEDSEINLDQRVFEKCDRGAYLATAESLGRYSVLELSITFPNALHRSVEIATEVYLLLFGLLTSAVHLQDLREHDRKGLSRRLIGFAALFGTGVVFLVALPSAQLFLLGIVLILPHLLLTFFGSLYLWLVSGHEAKITGTVKLDDTLADSASVVLQRLRPSRWPFGKERELEKLKRGKFAFYVLLWKFIDHSEYMLTVSHENATAPIESNVFALEGPAEVALETFSLDRRFRVAVTTKADEKKTSDEPGDN